jgi:hypothetical protein
MSTGRSTAAISPPTMAIAARKPATVSAGRSLCSAGTVLSEPPSSLLPAAREPGHAAHLGAAAASGGGAGGRGECP